MADALKAREEINIDSTNLGNLATQMGKTIPLST